MEKYVVSRELAQKLKDAGYPQETYHMHVKWELSEWQVMPSDIGTDIHLETLSGRRTDTVAAPMTDELLEQLPEYIPDSQVAGIYNLNIQKVYREYRATYGMVLYVKDGRMPETLAQAWLWLRDNGYALPGGINQTKVSA